VPNKQGSVSLVPVARELTEDDLSAIVDAARKRAELVGEMKAALLAHDDQLALELARKVCGIDQEAA
jgi:hypothetical protein